MRRLTISTFLAGIVGALVLGLLLFSGGSSTHAATGVTDPTAPGSIFQTAVDMNPSGNGAGRGNHGPVAITGITAGGQVTTSPAHQFLAGDNVIIAGTATCNGTYTILAAPAPTATKFNISCLSANGSGGTATVKNLLGAVDPVIGSVPLGSSIVIDVIEDEVNPADGNVYSIGGDLYYNVTGSLAGVCATSCASAPSMISIDGDNANPPTVNHIDGPSASAVCTLDAPDPSATAAVNGDWCFGSFNTTTAQGGTGEGIMVEVGITCNATTAGYSDIILRDNNNSGTPEVFGVTFGASPIPVSNVFSGRIYCGMAAPSTVTESVSATTTAPATFAVNSAFTVNGNATITNSSASPATVPTNDSVMLNLPSGCTTTSTNPATTSVSVPASSSASIPTQSWTVICTTTSYHQFSTTDTISISDPCCTLSGSSTTVSTSSPPGPTSVACPDSSCTGITATSDPAITSASTSSSAASACLPASPPAPGCATAPVVTVGDTQTVTVTKHLTNKSGFSPVPVSDMVIFIGAAEAPCTGAYCQNTGPSGGTVGPANTVTFLDGTTCVVNSSGTNPQTASLTAADTPLTFTFTATCSTDSFFDSLNPEQIALLFTDVLTSTDIHITDSNPANNCLGSPTCPGAPSAPISLAFWNRQPFHPVFTATDDSTPSKVASTAPADYPSTDNCLESGAAYPAGIPCALGINVTIPGPDPAEPKHDPLALPLIDVPQPDFFWAPGSATPDGTVTAGFGFSIILDTSGPCNTNPPQGQTYPALLKDGALPDNSTPHGTAAIASIAAGSPTVVTTTTPHGFINGQGVTITGDSGTGKSLPGANGTWIISAVTSNTFEISTLTTTTGSTGGVPVSYVPSVKGIGDPVNFGGVGPDTVASGVAMFGFAAWPVRLNQDATIQALSAGGAPLWRRYTANTSINTPVNILIYNMGTAWRIYSLTGDPSGAPTPPGQRCTPFSTQTDYLGKDTATGAPILQCNTPGTKVIGAGFIRADDYETFPTGDVVHCSPSDTSVTMTKNETLGISPEVDAGVTYTQTVTFTVTGTGDLSMSLVGPASCNPHWTNPLDSFPSVIGGTQTSVVDYGVTSGVVTATYSFNCAAPGDYSFQVIGNVSGASGEDLSNNQVENHVSVHVVADLDGDHIPNNTDACPTVAEDHDGLHGAEIAAGVEDGCPDTDVSVTATKEENYNVDDSVDTTKHVVITVTNGNFPATVNVHVLAVSQLGQCEVRLVHTVGDPNYSEWTTNEVAGPPNPDTLYSQLELSIPMTANSSQVIGVDYIIHCFQKSSHPAAFELQVDGVPVAPVVEENLGGDPITDPTNPHNNVYKNFPNVTSWDNADLQKGPCTLTKTPVGQANAGVAFTLTDSCTITNNGPVAAHVDDSATLSGVFNSVSDLPGDCTSVEPLTQNGSSFLLNSGSSVTDNFVWHVTCTAASNHTFTVNDTVSITAADGALHIKDPNAANNTGTASVVVPIFVTRDPNVVVSGTGTTCAPVTATTPTTGQHFTCTVTGTIDLDGWPGGSVTIGLSSSDCTLVATGGQGPTAAVNGPMSATWDVVCAGPSDHTFVGTVTLTPTPTLHYIDAQPSNDTGSDSVVVAIWLNASLSATITGMPAEIDISGATTTIHPVVDITSVPSPIGLNWTVSYTTDCTGAPANATTSGTTPVHATLSATLTVPAPGHECSVTVCVNATATDVHVLGTLTQVCSTSKIESNVLVDKYVLLIGPAAVNLSDTNGRYMWVISEIGNLASDTELVHISMGILEPVPSGCTRVISQVLPGQTQFLLSPGEQKVLVWRVRYECHAPAGGAQVINQSVTVGVTHCDPTTSAPAVTVLTSHEPGGICDANSQNEGVKDVESYVSDNAKTTVKQVILQ